jgi:hypothetical protein
MEEEQDQEHQEIVDPEPPEEMSSPESSLGKRKKNQTDTSIHPHEEPSNPIRKRTTRTSAATERNQLERIVNGVEAKKRIERVCIVKKYAAASSVTSIISVRINMLDAL